MDIAFCGQVWPVFIEENTFPMRIHLLPQINEGAFEEAFEGAFEGASKN